MKKNPKVLLYRKPAKQSQQKIFIEKFINMKSDEAS